MLLTSTVGVTLRKTEPETMFVTFLEIVVRWIGWGIGLTGTKGEAREMPARKREAKDAVENILIAACSGTLRNDCPTDDLTMSMTIRRAFILLQTPLETLSEAVQTSVLFQPSRMLHFTMVH